MAEQQALASIALPAQHLDARHDAGACKARLGRLQGPAIWTTVKRRRAAPATARHVRRCGAEPLNSKEPH